MLYDSARDEFSLPDYKNNIYREFVAKCYFNDFKLMDYFGQPGVKCEFQEIEDIRDIFDYPISWDHSGSNIIVYPVIH